LSQGAKVFKIPNANVALLLLLGVVFIALQGYITFSKTPVAIGAKRARQWAALTIEGVTFLRGVYAKTASKERTRKLSIQAAREVFGSAGPPLAASLFLGNSRARGSLAESEWVMRWHMAFAIDPKAATESLERLLVERQVKGDAFTSMVARSNPDGIGSRHKAAHRVAQVLVFGSKGCGKTAFINSFIEGQEELSTLSHSHGLTSHNLAECVEIEDADLGDGSENNGDQVLLLREIPAISDIEEVPEQVEELQREGILQSSSLILLLYSPFDASSNEYAESVHAVVSSFGIPHMFLRCKHDLHVAAYGECDRSYQESIKYDECPSHCDDQVVEVVSVLEYLYGDDDEDLRGLHEKIGWAGLNRQFFTCRNGGIKTPGWFESVFSMWWTRIVLLLLSAYLLYSQGPQAVEFLENWEYTRAWFSESVESFDARMESI